MYCFFWSVCLGCLIQGGLFFERFSTAGSVLHQLPSARFGRQAAWLGQAWMEPWTRHSPEGEEFQEEEQGQSLSARRRQRRNKSLSFRKLLGGRCLKSPKSLNRLSKRFMMTLRMKRRRRTMPLVDSEHLVLEVWTILPEHMKVFEIDHCVAKKQRCLGCLG